MAVILSVFSDYLKDMDEKFKKGNDEYVRHRLRTVTGFCLACHTRVSTVDFEDASRRVEQIHVTPFQKAEFYAATRQFDKAFFSFKLLLDTTPKDEMGIVQFTRALRHALNISVRVKQDPKMTYDLLDRLSKRRDLPEYDKSLIAAWKKDTAYWLKDPVSTHDLTGEALVQKGPRAD